MQFPMTSWVVCLFFLFSLILVARFKKQICAVDKDCFRNIIGGLIILLAVSLARVYNDLGAFQSLAFLSEPTFFRLISWIGAITGMAFIVFGASSWMPLARNSRRLDEARVQRLDFLRKVEQLVGVETRLDNLLATSLAYMIEHFGFAHGAVYKCFKSRRQLHLAALSSGSPYRPSELRRAVVAEGAIDGFGDRVAEDGGRVITGLPETVSPPEIVLPILVDNTAAGFYAIWTGEASEPEKEDYLNLKIAADIVGRKIALDRLRLEAGFIRRCDMLGRELAHRYRPEESLRENTAMLANALFKHLSFDVASVTFRDLSGERMRRLTVRPGETVLDEKGVPLPGEDSVVGKVLATGCPVVAVDLTRADTPARDRLLVDSGMRSCLSVPLVDSDGNTAGTLTVAGDTPGLYGCRQRELLARAGSVFAPMARAERQLSRIARTERRLARITDLVSEINRGVDLQTAFEHAADALSRELGTSLVRISVVEDGGAFLKSRALATPRPIERTIPADGQMILSLMPCHKLAIDSGRQLLIDQQSVDSRMSEAEATQVLTPQVKSAMLIPVRGDGRVVAMISAGEMRHPKRFSYDESDLAFAELVAELLAVVIRSSLEGRRRIDITTGRAASGLMSVIEDASVRSRLKSSLSGILGSVEILRSTPRRDRASIERYLRIIDRSAHKLADCLQEETTA
jgi:GAF domain-containing protein